jgi:hypothetical protein
MRHTILFSFLLLAVGSLPDSAHATDITLSDGGLMCLDWRDPGTNGSVLARRDVTGPGVEFDIYVPGNADPNRSVRFASTRYGGTGQLAGLDLSAYDNFSLTFTLLSANGSSAPGFQGALVVGALVYEPVNAYRYKPQIVDLGGWYGTTKTSSTALKDVLTDGLGFEAHLLSTTGWNPGGNTFTLLIQPTSGAVQIPEPSGIALLVVGIAIAITRTRSGRIPAP